MGKVTETYVPVFIMTSEKNHEATTKFLAEKDYFGYDKNYIKFLKTGSTKAPNEELKITGVDLTKKEVCDNAIKMFSDIVDEFEQTYNEYKKRSGGVNE